MGKLILIALLLVVWPSGKVGFPYLNVTKQVVFR